MVWLLEAYSSSWPYVTSYQQAYITCNVSATCRDHGPRGNRAKTRLIWLIEQLGFEPFANLVAETMGPGTKLHPAVHVTHDTPWERRDLLGVHQQKQEGLNWVGVSVPAGRITAEDLEVCYCSGLVLRSLQRLSRHM